MSCGLARRRLSRSRGIDSVFALGIRTGKGKDRDAACVGERMTSRALISQSLYQHYHKPRSIFSRPLFYPLLFSHPQHLLFLYLLLLFLSYYHPPPRYLSFLALYTTPSRHRTLLNPPILIPPPLYVYSI